MGNPMIKPWVRVVFVIACFLALNPLSFAEVRTIDVHGCIKYGLARRGGSDTCWASLPLLTKERAPIQLCISHKGWAQWLGSKGEAVPCGRWEGQWKTYALPENTDPSRKQPRILFRAAYFPKPESKMSPSFLNQWIWHWIRIIEKSRERTHEWLGPKDETGALTHLVTGTKRPDGKLDFLLLIGFVHVLSASGIHLYALARGWNTIMEKLCLKLHLSPTLGLAMARSASAATWTACWVLAGARPGMLRPWLIVVMRMIARRQGLKWRRWTPLTLALIVDLAAGACRGDLGIHSGRWIYALAVGGGLMAQSAPAMAVGSWVLAAVWQAWIEGSLALATPAASLITVGIYSGVIYPLILLSLVFKASGLSPVADELASVLGMGSEMMISGFSAMILGKSWVSGMWVVSRPALLGGSALAALMLSAHVRTKMTFTILLVAIRIAFNAIAVAKPRENVKKLTLPDRAIVEQLDIGQGDAALIRSNRSGIIGLVDVGSERALRDRDWFALLASRQITRIDWIALTHLDEDHVGGLKRLSRIIPVGCVATAREEWESPRGRDLQKELAPFGIRMTTWEGSCVPYPTLAPRKVEGSGGTRANANMGAVLVPLDGGGFYLSAGDATASAEPRIGEWAVSRARLMGIDQRGPRVLKVSHHGSRTSSNPSFVDTVRPTEAWISSGVGNRHGHPTADVLDVFRTRRIPIRRTDLEGLLQAGEIRKAPRIELSSKK